MADTREQILDAARTLIAERGYEATSFAAIAGRVGITKAAVAYHFHPKEALLAALVLPAAADVQTLLATTVDHTPEGRARFATSYLDALLDHRHVIGMLVGDPAVLAAPGVGDRVQALRDAVLGRVAGSLDPVDRTLGWAILGAVHIGIWRTLDQPADQVRPVLRRAVTALAAA